MKIIDAFKFFNEVEILEARIRFLGPYVDEFIVAEAEFTATGHAKASNFPFEADWFQPFREKTRVLNMREEEIAEWSQNLVGLQELSDNWIKEKSQRQFIASQFDRFEPDDLLFFSDLDEIWNPTHLGEVIDLTQHGRIAHLEQELYYYTASMREKASYWTHARAGRVQDLQGQDLSHIRLLPAQRNWMGRRPDLVRNMGWHFSWFGGIERMLQKLAAAGHQEFDAVGLPDQSRLLHFIQQGIPLDPNVKTKRRIELVDYRDHLHPELIEIIEQLPYMTLSLDEISKTVA